MRAQDYHWGAPPAATGSGTGAGRCPPSDSGVRGGGWAPTVGTAEPSLQEYQRRTEQHANNIAQSQQRALRLAESASVTGAATLEALHTQGEQLRHVRSEQAKIDANLATSERLLRGMESWGGAIRNAVSSWWGGGEETGAVQRAEPPSKPAPARAGASARADAVGIGGMADTKESEVDPMNTLCGIVSGLKVQADAMNEELRSHSSLIDGTIATSERQQVGIKGNTKRANKLLGR